MTTMTLHEVPAELETARMVLAEIDLELDEAKARYRQAVVGGDPELAATARTDQSEVEKRHSFAAARVAYLESLLPELENLRARMQFDDLEKAAAALWEKDQAALEVLHAAALTLHVAAEEAIAIHRKRFEADWVLRAFAKEHGLSEPRIPRRAPPSATAVDQVGMSWDLIRFFAAKVGEGGPF